MKTKFNGALVALLVLGPTIFTHRVFAAPLAPASCGPDTIPCVLSDRNSTTAFNPGSDPIRGMNSWKVENVEQMAQQWFWYRVGSTLDGNPSKSIDSLPFLSSTLFDNDADGDYETYTVQYGLTTGGFTISASFLLTGGAVGSTQSDIRETITIKNTNFASGSLEIHLFQYTDFDLSQDADNDSVVMPDAITFSQSDGVTTTTSVTMVGPTPNRHELSCFPDTLLALDDATTGYNLSNSPAVGATVGPCDATWAAQWDFLALEPNGVMTITADKNINNAEGPGNGGGNGGGGGNGEAPEPASLGLFGLGLAVLGFLQRRRLLSLIN